MRNAFINAILDECTRREDVFVISGDAGLGVFDDFQKQFPDRFLNLGVAEQNAATHAAGMAMAGFKVYLYNIVPFVLYRCYEQVRNDICYQELPVTLVGIGCGLSYAPMGMTHYSIEDLGVARSLPNLAVYSPADPTEAEAAARATLISNGPTYVRIAKRGEPNIHAQVPQDFSKPLQLFDGKDVAIVFHSTIADEVLAAQHILKSKDVAVKVISLPQIAPCPMDALNEMLKGIQHVVVVEEHYVNSGLGAQLGLWSIEHRPAWKMSCMGIRPEFVHAVKKQGGMREYYGISKEHIVSHVLQLLGRS